MTQKLPRRTALLAGGALLASPFVQGIGSALAQENVARRWVENEFQPSTLSREQAMQEMEWFIAAARPYFRPRPNGYVPARKFK